MNRSLAASQAATTIAARLDQHGSQRSAQRAQMSDTVPEVIPAGSVHVLQNSNGRKRLNQKHIGVQARDPSSSALCRGSKFRLVPCTLSKFRGLSGSFHGSAVRCSSDRVAQSVPRLPGSVGRVSLPLAGAGGLALGPGSKSECGGHYGSLRQAMIISTASGSDICDHCRPAGSGFC